MDNWLDTMRQVLYKLWMGNKISGDEYRNFMVSAKSGVKCSDIYARHQPISWVQRIETKKYMGKFQNNS